MRIYWKLLVVWLMSQMLGFALPAPPGVAEPEMLPCRAWEQTQSVNNAYDAGCRSPLAYDGELADLAGARWSELDILTQATSGYDCVPSFLFRKVDSPRAPPFGEGEFPAAKGPLRVDPAGLRLPPTRAEGADPFKLADQIKKYGTSTEGMPPIQVTRGANGEMMINDGVTRATRGAMTPGTTVPVQVIEENPALNLGNLPRVGERTPGRP